MTTILIFIGAAITEIAGCYSFWMWKKLGKSIFWLLPGTISLWIFAYLLTLIESEYAGRAYAVYGAIYISSSILWMWLMEQQAPNKFDLTGMAICFIGASVIVYASR